MNKLIKDEWIKAKRIEAKWIKAKWINKLKWMNEINK